jgi:UDP-glucose 4-epimerase
VTGGYGFIGVNLVRDLAGRGYSIRILDDLSTGHPEHLEGVSHETVEGDIRDADAVRAAFDGADAVVHLAASTSVLESVEDPGPTFAINVAGTLSVLHGARQTGVRRLVNASSNAALGEHPPPLDERTLPRPMSPYGASKLAAEAYCCGFAGTYGFAATSLRFANVYGPYSGHKTSVVAKFVRRMLAGEPLTIYGDGRQTRDFIHVDDIVQGIRLALEVAHDEPAFQIANGRETSVLELVERLGECAGTPPRIEWLPPAAGEVRRNSSSIELARARLGFEPAFGLDTGLPATWSWLETRYGAAR